MPRSIRSLLLFALTTMTISLWAQTGENNPFINASRSRGDFLPFQYPVSAGEFPRDPSEVSKGHVLTNPSPGEAALRNYFGTVADFKSKFNNPTLAQSIENLASRFAEGSNIPISRVRVVMLKNKRGFYIPQLRIPRKVNKDTPDPWNPQFPKQNMQQLPTAFEDLIFRPDSRGVPQLVSCPRDIKLDDIKSRAQCQIPELPKAKKRNCSDDVKIADFNRTFEEVANQGINCTKGENQPTNEYLCLACNLYFESRGEGPLGMDAVAELTLADQAYQIRRGTESNTPICDAVYKKNRFSWTLDPAVVDLSQTKDRESWHEALYISSQMATQSGASNPIINDPKLHCYRYYVSTLIFKTFEELPSWGRTFYSGTRNKSKNFRPLCIGNHIFLRDPDEKSCPQPDITTTPERDVSSITHREMFFRDCLDQENPPPPHSSPDPAPIKLCSGNTIEDAIRAHRDTGVDYSPPHSYIEDVNNAK